jgi:hypothetical protein
MPYVGKLTTSPGDFSELPTKVANRIKKCHETVRTDPA